MKVTVRGQVVLMEDLFYDLKLGLIVTVIAIFLLLAANFQSFRLSLAIILTIPAVSLGWVTRTTLNTESLIGAIMAIGVAVANAILLVTFAERNRIGGAPVPDAAVDEAVGLGEGASQTAPLGRAVIGALTGAPSPP